MSKIIEIELHLLHSKKSKMVNEILDFEVK